MIRIPFFLLFGFNKGTKKKKGKRVLLGNLVNSNQSSSSHRVGLPSWESQPKARI